MAESDQFRAELAEVVDLPVLDDVDAVAPAGHRLMAVLQIDHAEASGSERREDVDVKTLVVRPAVPERPGHPPKDCQAGLRRSALEKPGDSAHRRRHRALYRTRRWPRGDAQPKSDLFVRLVAKLADLHPADGEQVLARDQCPVPHAVMRDAELARPVADRDLQDPMAREPQEIRDEPVKAAEAGEI